MSYLVRNKRSKQEQVWSEEDMRNARANKLMDRFVIVKKMDDTETTPQNVDLLKFVTDHQRKFAPEVKPDIEPEVKEQPKRIYKRKNQTDE
jgi:hypothetical protein